MNRLGKDTITDVRYYNTEIKPLDRKDVLNVIGGCHTPEVKKQ